MRHVLKIGILFLLALLVASPAIVRAQQAVFEVDNVATVVGVMVGVAPDYVGSDDYKGIAAPYFKYTLPKSYQTL